VVCRSPEMFGAAPQYEERGGILQRAHHASSDAMNPPSSSSGEAQSNSTSSNSTSTTQHDFRFPRRPVEQKPGEVSTSPSDNVPPCIGATANAKTKTSTNIQGSGAGSSAQDKLDLLVASNARKELLRESFFPAWKDDAAGEELDSPDEMQKKDPLATQIWRLYSKTKKQLPNQERMENLTWRMMAMSLRKRRQEEAARYVLQYHTAILWWWFHCL
jgi:GATA-binding protein